MKYQERGKGYKQSRKLKMDVKIHTVTKNEYEEFSSSINLKNQSPSRICKIQHGDDPSRTHQPKKDRNRKDSDDDKGLVPPTAESSAPNTASFENQHNDDSVCFRNMVACAAKKTVCDDIIIAAGDTLVCGEESVTAKTSAAARPLIVKAFANACGPSSSSMPSPPSSSSPTRSSAAAAVTPSPSRRRKTKRPGTLNDYILQTTSSSSPSSSVPSKSSTSTGTRSGAEDMSELEGDEIGYNHRRISLGRVESIDGSFIVFVGDEAFHHPYSIFSDASHYIVERMTLNHDTLGNFLDFSNHSAHNWKAVLNFLEEDPTIRNSDGLTWPNIPLVLPWFNELNAKDLLKEVDLFLLEAVVAARMDEDEGTIWVQNLLLLTYIAHRCQLNTTLAQSRQWLRKRIQDPSLSNNNNDSRCESSEISAESSGQNQNTNNGLVFSLQNLQFLSRMMSEFEELRDYLWESAIIDYLPHDLNVEDSHGLVSNQLFPYLLREGMVQVSIIQEEKQKDSNFELSPRSVSSSTTPIRANRLSQDMLHVFLTSTFEEIEHFEKEKTAPLSKKQIKMKANQKLMQPPFQKLYLSSDGQMETTVDGQPTETEVRFNPLRLESIAATSGVFQPVFGLPRTFEC